MAVQGNMYALLEGDDENLLSRFDATTVTAEMRKDSRRTLPQNLSKLQSSSDKGSLKGRDKRQNGNDFKKYIGQQDSRNSFRPDNGYRPDERPGYSSKQRNNSVRRQHGPEDRPAHIRKQHGPDDRPALIRKQHEGQRNSSQKREYRPDGRPVYNSKQHEEQRRKQESGQRPADHHPKQDDLKKEAEANECRPHDGSKEREDLKKESEANGCRPGNGSKEGEGNSDDLKKEGVSDDGEEWQVIRRRNHPHRRFGSLGNEEGGVRNRRGERRREFVGEGNGERRRWRRREFSVGGERNGERNDGIVGRGERNGDARRGRGRGRWFQVDTNGEIVEELIEAKVDKGMPSLEEKKDNAASKSVVASKEPEFKNSKEPEFRMASKELESKNSKQPTFRKWNRDQRMTLKDYEKKLEEKRKVLESLKNQEQRVVTLDKEFESMRVVEKKKEEEDPIFVKLNSENGRPKKATTVKNGNNTPKPIVTNFKVAGTNYSENRVRRYSLERNGVYPRHNGYSKENGNDSGSYPRRKEGHKVDQKGNGGYPIRKGGHDDNSGIGYLKREEEKPSSIENQFPWLYIGTMKTNCTSA